MIPIGEMATECLVEDVTAALAMELWLKMGRPSTLPPPATPDTKALCGLYVLHSHYNGNAVSTEQAMKLIREAAAENCLYACEYLGWEDVSQPETDVDEKEMTAYAWKAARAGRAEPLTVSFAMHNIGRAEHRTINAAMERFLDQVSPMDPNAAWYLAFSLGEDYPEESLMWAKRALADGSKRADYEIGAALMRLGRPEEAYEHLSAGADKGDSRCGVVLLHDIESDSGAYLAYGMHRDRYLKLGVSDGNPDGLQAYAENLLLRDKPGDAVEACKALVALQQSFQSIDDLPHYSWSVVAQMAYPKKKGRVPLKPAWDWIWDRLAAAPIRANLIEYQPMWEDYAFNPDLDKKWLDLLPPPL